MKPFNLEAAKAGAPIVSRDGEQMKFIAHVPEACESHRVVVVSSTDGAVGLFYENGAYYSEGQTSSDDLCMAPQKRTVWVNFYNSEFGPAATYFITEEKADRGDQQSSQRIGGKAYPVEIDV